MFYERKSQKNCLDFIKYVSVDLHGTLLQPKFQMKIYLLMEPFGVYISHRNFYQWQIEQLTEITCNEILTQKS